MLLYLILFGMDWFIIILLILLSICTLLCIVYFVFVFIEYFKNGKIDNTTDKTKTSLNIMHLHNLIRGGF